LKAAVSVVAEELLHLFGFPVGRSGVTLTVGPYKLMVADACAGLNSIFALEAVGVFYLSLMPNATKARKLLLAACILPISFVSNVVRVMALVLVTYYFGDEAGQGFVHGFAGILLFVVATVLTIGADGLIRALSGIQARHGKN
jgi:exosortase